MHVCWKRRSTRTWCFQQRCAIPGLVSLLGCAASGQSRHSARVAQRIPRRPATGFREVSGLLRRILWKYTHNAYDFSVLGALPHVPDRMAQLQDSRICGTRQRAELPRILGPFGLLQRCGALFHSADRRSRRCSFRHGGNAFTPFRIDHDERFNQTTHLQYQPWQARAVARLQLAL